MKRIFYIILFVVIFSFINVSAEEFSVTAKNIILYNLNDQSIIYEKNSEERVSIASITKIMTTLVALENIDDLNDTVIITADDFAYTSGYSKAGFSVGDQVTYEDLLYGILLPSGADAVNAVVNNTLGFDAFVTAMNNLAQKIGLENTSFSNPIGKDDDLNYSTAKDVAKMLKYALENPEFKKIFTTKEYQTTSGLTLQSTLMPYKDLLSVSIIDGSKSGFTKEAGRCLASIATINDVPYLLVVIRSSNEFLYNAIADSLTIYDYYSHNYSYQVILDNEKVITTIPIKFSKTKEYSIKADEDISLYLKNNTTDNLTYEFTGLDEIKYNTKKDTYLGKIKVYNDNNLLYESNVYLNTDIEYYNFYLIGIILIILLFIIVIIWKIKRKKRRRRKRR